MKYYEIWACANVPFITNVFVMKEAKETEKIIQGCLYRSSDLTKKYCNARFNKATLGKAIYKRNKTVNDSLRVQVIAKDLNEAQDLAIEAIKNYYNNYIQKLCQRTFILSQEEQKNQEPDSDLEQDF